MPQGKIKAIITNINRSDQELEKKFPTKPKNQSHQNKIPIMYIISKDTKNAKIIKKCYLEGSVMAFITGHACQKKCQTIVLKISIAYLLFQVFG